MSDCVVMSTPNPIFPVVISPSHHTPLTYWPSHYPHTWPGHYPPPWPSIPPHLYTGYHPQAACNGHLPQLTEGINQSLTAIDNFSEAHGLDDGA